MSIVNVIAFITKTDIMQVLRDNLGDDWDEACATLMTEMRMYEVGVPQVTTMLFNNHLYATLMTEMRMYELECLR